MTSSRAISPSRLLGQMFRRKPAPAQDNIGHLCQAIDLPVGFEVRVTRNRCGTQTRTARRGKASPAVLDGEQARRRDTETSRGLGIRLRVRLAVCNVIEADRKTQI